MFIEFETVKDIVMINVKDISRIKSVNKSYRIYLISDTTETYLISTEDYHALMEKLHDNNLVISAWNDGE